METETRDQKISRYSGGRGYAFMTQDQKNELNAFTPPMPQADRLPNAVQSRAVEGAVATGRAGDGGVGGGLDGGEAEAAGTVSRYTNPSSELSKAFGEGGIYGKRTPMTADDETKIREDARKAAQARVDSINELFEREIARTAFGRDNRSGKARALASATGNLGAPTGNFIEEEATRMNEEEVATYRAQQRAEIESILTETQNRADEKIKMQRDEIMRNSDAYFSFLDKTAQQARQDLATIAKSGQKVSGSALAALKDQTGLGDAEFDALFKSIQIANAPADTYINKDKPQIVGNKAIFFKQVKDPVTGQSSIQAEELALPEGAAAKGVKETVSRDDGIYVFYEDGTWEKIGEKSAAMVKAQGGTPGKGGTPTKITAPGGKIAPEGQALINASRTLRYATVEESERIQKEIADRVASGDVAGATEALRDFGYQKMKAAQQQDYDLYDNAASALDSVVAQLDEGGMTAGPYKALFESAKPWLTLQRDKKYADLRGTIELGQAQIRKGYYGTAVTGTEAGNAKNFLIDDSDDIDTIRWKTENAKNFLTFVNDATIARQIGLPKPDIKDYVQKEKPKAAAPAAGGAAGGEDEIAVISPDGTPGFIPYSQLAEARKLGYKVDKERALKK